MRKPIEQAVEVATLVEHREDQEVLRSIEGGSEGIHVEAPCGQIRCEGSGVEAAILVLIRSAPCVCGCLIGKRRLALSECIEDDLEGEGVEGLGVELSHASTNAAG